MVQAAFRGHVVRRELNQAKLQDMVDGMPVAVTRSLRRLKHEAVPVPPVVRMSLHRLRVQKKRVAKEQAKLQRAMRKAGILSYLKNAGDAQAHKASEQLKARSGKNDERFLLLNQEGYHYFSKKK